MSTRRRSDPLKRTTVYIDPLILDEITHAFPGLSLGAAIEAMWRSDATFVIQTPNPTPSSPNPAPRVSNPLQKHVMGQINGIRQCKRCGSTDETTYCTPSDPKGTK